MYKRQALLVATIGEAPLSASTAILMLMLAFHSIRLPTGVPAMLNLVLAAFLGAVRGAQMRGELAFRLSVVRHAALTFWLWACWKVAATGDRDFGAVTFLPLLVVSARGGEGSSSRAFGVQLALSTGLITWNYGLVFAWHGADLPFGFNAYLGVGMFYWAALGVWALLAVPLRADLRAAQEAWLSRHAGSAV